jgi:hypothetical protein
MSYDFTLSYCCVSLTVLAVLWFYFVPKLRRDAYRCRIRGIRDGLFDFVWKNGYDFDDPAYRKARETLNSLLSISNALSPTLLVLGTAFAMRTRDNARNEMPLPAGPFGDRIREAYQSATSVTFEFVFLKGIFGIFVRLTLWLMQLLRLAGRFRGWTQRVLNEAVHDAPEVLPRMELPSGRFSLWARRDRVEAG